MSEEYNYQEHLHRYAIWTAARAQRGIFASNKILKDAIEKIGLKEKVFQLSFDTTANEFDSWHLETTKLLLTSLQEKDSNKGVKFGRGAKIINIYLKTTLVIPNCKHESELLKNIHPPIDSILLAGLIEKEILSNEFAIPWTTMEEETYKEIIRRLRSRKEITSLWMAEKYWSPDKKVISKLN